MAKKRLTRDKVISVVNGKALVGVYWADTDGSEILFECSPKKADRIMEIFNCRVADQALGNQAFRKILSKRGKKKEDKSHEAECEWKWKNQ